MSGSWKNASSEKRVAAAIKTIEAIGRSRRGHRDSNKAHGYGTLHRHTGTLVQVDRFMGDTYHSRIHFLTPEKAQVFLERRSMEVTQKSLNVEKRGLEMFLRCRDGNPSIALKTPTSEITRAERSRAYSPDQVRLISDAQSERMSLSTRLAEAAGLRAAELYTLQLAGPGQRGPQPEREWREDRFLARPGEQVRYTVQGKGGLVREVSLPAPLATELEARRLDEPRVVVDRQIGHETRYDVVGGQRLSSQFTRVSRQELGWSEGVHGVRHSYAQTRIAELADAGVRYPEALAVVSQEMGHFRPSITEVYLR